MSAFWQVTKSHQDTKYSGECEFCSESIFLKMCSIVGENTSTTNRIKKFGGRLYPLQFVADNSNHNEADDANYRLHCSLSVSYLIFYTFMWRLDQTFILFLLTETAVFAFLGLRIFSFPHQLEPALVIWSIVFFICWVNASVLKTKERIMFFFLS